ncbi:MAG: dipeptide epimerase, partial [Desulfobacterales bacterium]|nr:dipeptide epimerase [Desulfobacterales bacterium]
MKIVDIKTGRISVPLKTPFKTALRTVTAVNDVIVQIITDTGNVGFGEAPPTGVITGDTHGSIEGAIAAHIRPALLGRDLADFEGALKNLNACIVGNNSAKAACDMALYDLFGQMHDAPLYSLLGGAGAPIVTDITVSVNDPQVMAADSRRAVDLGYKTLKIKVGTDARADLERMQAIRDEVGYDIDLRIDANQGWKPKEAVKLLRQMEDAGLDIEFVEQPVHRLDFEGMKHVTDNVSIPVLADESVMSPMDAITIMQMRAADLVNIKLMKTGGIYNALKICAAAEVYDVPCMIG